MKLSDLRVGDQAEVTAVGAEPAVRRRLMDMGLVRGTRITVHRVAPLGDPIEVRFKGLRLAMRVQEADGISVRHLSSEAGSGPEDNPDARP